MSVASDFFIAEFGDRFLEFELSVDAIRYEDGDAVVDWSVEKINDQLGGITWEIVLNTVGGTDTAVRDSAGFAGSGTLRAPADPGSTVDLILYDTFNTDHEPGDGLDDDGEAQVNVQTPFPEPDEELLSVESCSSGGEVTVGEETTVAATVANANAVGVDADVTIEAGGTDATETVRVPADGTATVDVTFAFDEPGEYAPSVSVSL